MARIGPSSGTRPERILRESLSKFSDVRFNDRTLPGSPDAVLNSKWRKIAFFTDGRHWHDPKTAVKHQRSHHQTDWIAKAKNNLKRDRRVDKELLNRGFSVVRIWDECTFKASEYILHCRIQDLMDSENYRFDTKKPPFYVRISGKKCRVYKLKS